MQQNVLTKAGENEPFKVKWSNRISQTHSMIRPPQRSSSGMGRQSKGITFQQRQARQLQNWRAAAQGEEQCISLTSTAGNSSGPNCSIHTAGGFHEDHSTLVVLGRDCWGNPPALTFLEALVWSRSSSLPAPVPQILALLQPEDALVILQFSCIGTARSALEAKDGDGRCCGRQVRFCPNLFNFHANHGCRRMGVSEGRSGHSCLTWNSSSVTAMLFD